MHDLPSYSTNSVNANVTVGYDLSRIDYKIDEASKTLHIINIPEEEIKISPDSLSPFLIKHNSSLLSIPGIL